MKLKKTSSKCKYELINGIYYMICDGKKIPVDIDAPPQFKSKINEPLIEQRDYDRKNQLNKNKEELEKKVEKIACEIFKLKMEY